MNITKSLNDYDDNMVYVAIVIFTIGLLLIWGGRIFVSIQKQKGNPKFQDEEYVKKFTLYRRIVTLVLVLIAFVILEFV